MNGGSFTRATRKPLTKPMPAPTRRPQSTEISAGRPYRKVNCPMTTEVITMIAPTDRSMPAVSTTSVCALPTMPVMATCWMMSVSA